MKNENKSTGISLSGICITVFLVFLVLKLTNTVTWSWWAVFAPLLIPAGLFLILFVIVFVVIVVREVMKQID